MSTIKKVQFYRCPECDTSHSSKVKASECLEKCTNKKAKSKAAQKEWDKKVNRLRLEAKSMYEVLDLIVKYSFEFFGAELKITDANLSFGMVSCSHSAPVGKQTNWCGRDKNLPTEFLGWSGNISGKWIANGKNRWGEEIDGFTRLTEGGGLVGIHTGTFNGGSRFNGEFRFFLDDFPKLKEKYKSYKKLVDKEKALQEQQALQAKKVAELAQSMIAKDNVIADLESEFNELEERRDEVVEELHTRKGGYKDSVEKEKDITFPIAKRFSYDKKKLEMLGRTFSGRNGRR